MRTVLVTGSDTGVGKTRVVAALARLLAVDGARVEIVKVVETGRNATDVADGDAEFARRLSGADVSALTLASFVAALAPAAAARAAGAELSFDKLVAQVRALPEIDWRILEGAGGIATPVGADGRDWADFAAAVAADATVVVIPDRLGAINQARLAYARATQAGLRAGIWLNACAPVDAAVAASTREALAVAEVPVWGEQACGSILPENPEAVCLHLLAGATAGYPEVDAANSDKFPERCRRVLDERAQKGLRRILRVTQPRDDVLNLADNDYLSLARDPAVAAAVTAAVIRHGTSASASPLITGWRESHEQLVGDLCAWHGFPCGLLWSSGYAANSAVLGVLPQKGDLVLADRLVHHSMIAGLLRSGARLQRYEHLGLEQLEKILGRETPARRTTFVVTESVFSMDGDIPDLRRLADLKRRFGFHLMVDEAHALGWYGPEGSGLARGAGVEAEVDVLIGTLGKTLASGGAYTLFRKEVVRDFVVNQAGEFIYSTGLSPLNVAAAAAALARVRILASEQDHWHERSRAFRANLRTAGWDAADGESPIVPVQLSSASAAVAAADALRERGILAAAVRPPTVPAGTSRLRFSLKRTFDDAAAARVIAALDAWRAAR